MRQVWLYLVAPPGSVFILCYPAHPIWNFVKLYVHNNLDLISKTQMGRYRPPQPVGSKYITAEGHKRLTEEHDYLWKKKRPEVTRILSAAAAEGDRSENAEYIYRKKELREIDARVRFLRKRLDDMIIVDRIPKNRGKIYFGAWVTVEDNEGTEKTYRVVGPDEFDPKLGYISMDSPMGKALLGKSLDDEISITVDSKGGPLNSSYIINEIRYTEDTD
jgi:transcription elongation factor GreB